MKARRCCTLELHHVNTPDPCDTLYDLHLCTWGSNSLFRAPTVLVGTQPQSPFQIYGNTYYVGPHGLSSILITSDAGHVLIDGGLAESAGQIATHIRQLGFRVEDIKLIVNSHVHFDHAGGIAELQRLSGARVVASKWTAEVMAKSGVGRDDPQYGVIPPIALIKHVEVLSDGQTFKIGPIVITAHLTPGHTPGGTSWTWQVLRGRLNVSTLSMRTALRRFQRTDSSSLRTLSTQRRSQISKRAFRFSDPFPVTFF